MIPILQVRSDRMIRSSNGPMLLGVPSPTSFRRNSQGKKLPGTEGKNQLTLRSEKHGCFSKKGHIFQKLHTIITIILLQVLHDSLLIMIFYNMLFYWMMPEVTVPWSWKKSCLSVSSVSTEASTALNKNATLSISGKETLLGGGFQMFFIFTPTWGNDLIWLIIFRWVETTNYSWTRNRKTSRVRKVLGHAPCVTFVPFGCFSAFVIPKSCDSLPFCPRKTNVGRPWKGTFHFAKASIFRGPFLKIELSHFAKPYNLLFRGCVCQFSGGKYILLVKL